MDEIGRTRRVMAGGCRADLIGAGVSGGGSPFSALFSRVIALTLRHWPLTPSPSCPVSDSDI